MPFLTLAELARRVAGELHGDGELVVDGVLPLAEAGPSHLSFVTDRKYRVQAEASAAGAFLVGRGVELGAAAAARPRVVVADPQLALNDVIAWFHPAPPAPAPGVHPTAVVAASARVAPSAAIGPYAVVGEASEIGEGAVLHPHVVVGRGCRLGAGVVLHPHVVVYDGSELGARTVVHAGAVVGSDGFGYVSRRGVHHKVPQVGRVVVEEDVEIGANATLDRALLAETRIGAGTKIDNLVQIGHNVRVGRACILCGQVGIAGSATLGDGVVLAGQVGVAGHLEIGSGTMVAAKSAVLQSVDAGQQVGGIPTVELGAWRRQVAMLGRLERLQRRVAALERAAPAATGDAPAPRSDE